MPEKLKIDSIAYRGDGVGRGADGRVWFVPGVCDGETVLAEPLVTKKTFIRGKVAALCEPSPDRLETPECRAIPGCVYGHASYEAELRWKRGQLLSFLGQAKIPDAPALLLDSFASPKRLHYRNKISLHYEAPRKLGYVGDDNVSVTDIFECPLAAPEINEALAEYRRDPDFWSWVANEDGAVLRWTKNDGVVVTGQNSTRRGTGANARMLTEHTSTLGDVLVPETGFYQVNNEVADALAEHAAKIAAAKNPSAILDLYCGVGVLGLAAARMCGGNGIRVYGCDTGPDVIRAAKTNAKKTGSAGNAKFWCAKAKEMMGWLANDGVDLSNALTIVDPPRAGLEPEVLRALADNPPGTLLYVSCAPDTLARDLRVLLESGRQQVKSARLFDMFPRTAHFETCVELIRTN